MPMLVLPFPAIDPVLIQIGPFAIRWYALAYIVGILARLALRRARSSATQQLWGGPGADDRHRLSTTSSSG